MAGLLAIRQSRLLEEDRKVANRNRLRASYPIVHISSPGHSPGKEDGISLIAPHRVTLCLMMLLWLAWPRIGQAAGFLHTHGVDIVDENGQKVILRGVGLGNWLLPEGYMCASATGRIGHAELNSSSAI